MIGLLFWAFVLILALSYFGVTIQEIVNTPAGQASANAIFAFLSQIIQWVVQILAPK